MRILVIVLVLVYLMLKTKPALDIIEQWAAAIKTFEGWYVGSRSYRNNNPGNLKYAGQYGATGQDEQGHAIFATYELGWRALCQQLSIAACGGSAVYRPDMTLLEFFSHYAEANSQPYAVFVASQLGVTPETTLETIVAGSGVCHVL